MVDQSIVSLVTVKKISTLFCSIMLFISLIGCQQHVRVLSLSDARLPAAAKQRIADGEDAVLIAQTQVAHAKKVLDKTVARQVRFLQSAPNLGTVQNSSESLMAQRVGLREQELKYLQADLALSRSRLRLIYAQTAMRYDLKVYNLEPLENSMKKDQKRMLRLRAQLKPARKQWETSLSTWWTAYRQWAQGSQGTHQFWAYEFGL
jgi:hypothetical protein